MTSSNPSDGSFEHGLSAYSNGLCNCDAVCRPAWNAYMREYRRLNNLEINARRRARRRAAVLRVTGEEYDFEELLEHERNRNGLT